MLSCIILTVFIVSSSLLQAFINTWNLGNSFFYWNFTVFLNAPSFNDDISTWQTGAVTSMRQSK